MGRSQVVHCLVDLGVALGAAKANAAVISGLGPIVRRAPLALAMVEVIRRRGRAGEILGWCPGRGILAGQPLHLLGLGGGAGHLLTLAEVTLVFPDGGGGGGVPRLLPQRPAAVLLEAAERAVQAGDVDLAVRQNGAGDHLAGDGLPPDFTSGCQVETSEVMAVVAAAVGVGHEDAAAFHRGHAQEWIPKPFLPHRAACYREHFELAALGVKDNPFLGHHRRRGPVIFRLILPHHLPGDGVEGIELVTAEAAPQKHPPAGQRRGRQRMPARDGHLPAARQAVRAGERHCLFHFG